ncbi:MAG TPA: nuclear transport factor 2 family protein [Rhizomicrobium sp.]|jgi:PhnB protein|nr:nuclear transport factor 2 family protein [Rhizomicrobium sp.]
MTAETDIRAVLAARTKALHDKDPDATLALYVPGALMFELAPPLAGRVDAQARGGYAAWFETWTGPIVYETRDFAIEQHGEDFAFATGFVRMAGTKTDGSAISSWFRQTVAFTKASGTWRIAHQHTSVPFYMDGSFRAAVDLQP